MRTRPIIEIYLDKRRIKANGTYPLKIKLTFNMDRRYYPIGVSLNVNDFNKVIKNGKINPELQALREDISKVRFKVENICNKLEFFSFEAFDDAYYNNVKNPKEQDLYSTYQEIILKGNISLGTKLCYQNSMNAFKRFMNSLSGKDKTTIYFKIITSDLLYKWDEAMRKEGKSTTTIGIYMRCLRAVINYAIDRKYTTKENYPFGGRKYIPPTKSNAKLILEKSEMKLIYEAELMIGSGMRLARDFFILSYLWNGMNIGDILNLKNKDYLANGITYYRIKTFKSKKEGEKPIQVQFGISWKEKMKETVELYRNSDTNPNAYLFDILKDGMSAKQRMDAKKNFIKLINKYLKRLIKQLGINKQVTTYTARHVFASMLLNEGSNLNDIKDLLGHGSITTTQNYLHTLSNSKTTSAINNLI